MNPMAPEAAGLEQNETVSKCKALLWDSHQRVVAYFHDTSLKCILALVSYVHPLRRLV